MGGYYTEKLEGERLRRCYEIASPRVRQYLEAEIQFVIQHLDSTDSVLELGCGYGRVAFRLAEGLSRVDRNLLLEQALRVVKPGGRLFFSTYSEKFWDDRLEWFEVQAAEGLLGEIDYAKTGNGVIVCRDGFRSGCMSPEELRSFGTISGLDPEISEVDGSSVFCEIAVPGARG